MHVLDVIKVLRDVQEHQVHQDLQEHQVNQDLQEHQVHQELHQAITQVNFMKRPFPLGVVSFLSFP